FLEAAGTRRRRIAGPRSPRCRTLCLDDMRRHLTPAITRGQIKFSATAACPAPLHLGLFERAKPSWGVRRPSGGCRKALTELLGSAPSIELVKLPCQR